MFHVKHSKGDKTMNKRYYNCIRKTGDTITCDVWLATEMTIHRQVRCCYDFIIPLDRKPRNTPIKEG